MVWAEPELLIVNQDEVQGILLKMKSRCVIGLMYNESLPQNTKLGPS